MAYTKTNWVNEGPPAIDADNLNKIEDGIYDNSIQIEALQNDTVIYQAGSMSWSAGTPGTRGQQKAIDIRKPGYEPVSATVSYIADSSAVLPIAFFSSNMETLYVNLYRANTAAYSSSGNAVSVKVYYRKV